MLAAGRSAEQPSSQAATGEASNRQGVATEKRRGERERGRQATAREEAGKEGEEEKGKRGEREKILPARLNPALFRHLRRRRPSKRRRKAVEERDGEKRGFGRSLEKLEGGCGLEEKVKKVRAAASDFHDRTGRSDRSAVPSLDRF